MTTTVTLAQGPVTSVDIEDPAEGTSLKISRFGGRLALDMTVEATGETYRVTILNPDIGEVTDAMDRLTRGA